MTFARYALPIVLSALLVTGCWKSSSTPKALAVTNTGEEIISLKTGPPHDSDNVQVGAQGTKIIRPAPPMHMGDITVSLNKENQLEVTNSGSTTVEVSYTTAAGESKTEQIDPSATFSFGYASEVMIDDATFSVVD